MHSLLQCARTLEVIKDYFPRKRLRPRNFARAPTRAPDILRLLFPAEQIAHLFEASG